MLAPNSNTGGEEPFEVRLRTCHQTDVGQAREKNEDNLGQSSPEETGKGWLFIVADGMGGAAAGRTASTMAVDNARRAYAEYVAQHPLESPFLALKHAIEQANLAIFERSRSDATCRGMGTTMVAMAVVGDQAFTAHVGDSRIYRFRDGRLERMMRDHTRVQVLSDQGIITPAEAGDHPESHVINRNLGGRPDVEVDTPEDGPFDLQEGDTYLLCSDGLHGLVDDEAITRILTLAPPEQAAPALIELANRRGGFDNITVSIVCAGEGPAAWANLNPRELQMVVDRLAVEEHNDTAIFEAFDPDGMGPSDFDTQRIRAVLAGEAPGATPSPSAPAPASAPGEGPKPRGQAAHNTVMIDAPLALAQLADEKARATEANSSVAAPAPGAVESPSGGSSKLPFIIGGVVLVLGLIAVVGLLLLFFVLKR